MHADIGAAEGTEEVDTLIEEANNGPVLAVEESSFECPVACRTTRTGAGTCTAWIRLQKVICTEEQNHKHCCKVVSPQEKMGCSKVPEGIAAAELWLG